MRGRKPAEEVPNRPDFGYWLRESRKAAKLTQRELAEAVGLSFQYISNLETNRGNTKNGKPTHMRSEQIIALAEALKLDVDNALVLWGFAPRREGDGAVVSSDSFSSKIFQMDGASEEARQTVKRLLDEAQRLREAADLLERTAEGLKGIFGNQAEGEENTE